MVSPITSTARETGLSTTGFAVFDDRDRLLELNAALFEGADIDPETLVGQPLRDVIKRMLPGLISFDGDAVEDTTPFIEKMAAAWSQSDGSPIEVRTADERWKLLSCHPRPGGGTAFISVDITEFKAAQITLRENEELFRCVSETHPLPVWMADAKTAEILYESRSASKLLGRDWDPDRPQYISEHYANPKDREEVKRQLVESGGLIDDREVLFRRADGTEFWISASVRTNVYEGREVLIAGVLDLSERKAREEELRDARETLSDAIESLSEGFALYGKDERLVMCNSRYKEFHTRCSDIIEPYVKWSDVMETAVERGQYPDAVGREQEWLDEHQIERKEFGVSHVYELADDRWMEAVTTSTRQGGFVVTRSDVTDRMRLAREQSSREEQLHFLIENHPMPVWMNDATTGEIISESKVTADLFGRDWCGDEPVFARDYFFEEEEYVAAARELRDKRVIEDWEVRLRKADGEPIWVICNAKWTEYQGRQVVLAGIIDVTRRREREEHFRFLIENHPLPVALTDAETGQVVYESPAGARLFGREWSSEQPIDAYAVYVRPDERNQLLERVRKDGELIDFQTQLKKTDGTAFWAAINARLGEYQGREVILTGISDQSERIERERELTRARELLNDAIESLAEGFALYDDEDRLVMCNQRYREMHPSCAELLEPGIKWLDFLRVGAERGQFLNAIGRIEEWLEERERDRKTYRRNHEFQHSDGRWYSVSNCATRHGGAVVTRVDITERKRMEQEERERDALLRQVLDACPVPIQMTRVDGKVLYRSPATKMLFGEVATSRDYYVEQADREAYLEDLITNGFVEDYEVRLKAADGNPFWGSVSANVIDFQGDQVIVSNTADLTERKEVEKELSRQREALHQSEKLSALGELLAGVAHELNNPLSIVLGQALLLKETAADDATAERAAKIGNAADRCSRIVKTFLAMARQQPGQVKPLDINEVLEQAMEVAVYSLRSSDVHVKLKLQGRLPNVLADGDQLSQVFINLLVNAQHALEEIDGERRLTLTTAHDPKTREILVKIADNGGGIPPDILSRVFEPFFTTKEVGSGTGIGLAFCHRIVERHKGSISVDSTMGVGTTFVVRLPVSTAFGDQADAPDDAVLGQDKLSILVIDDEVDVAELIAEILAADGHKVAKAHSGLSALRMLGRAHFDIILSDLKMPNLDGPSLFQELKESDPDMVGRLAFVTGDTMSPKAREFLESSGRPFIEKPIRPEDLRDLVNHLTENI